MPPDPHLIKAEFLLARANPVPSNRTPWQEKHCSRWGLWAHPSCSEQVVSYMKAGPSLVREAQAPPIGGDPRIGRDRMLER